MKSAQEYYELNFHMTTVDTREEDFVALIKSVQQDAVGSARIAFDEHDLLNAVAEAAKPFLTAPPDTYYICPDASGVGCIGENLRKALAALKSFREGGK